MKKTILSVFICLTIASQAQVSTFGNTYASPTTSPTNGNSFIGAYNIIGSQSTSYGSFVSGWGNTMGTDQHQVHLLGSGNVSANGLNTSFAFGNFCKVNANYAFAIGGGTSGSATNLTTNSKENSLIISFNNFTAAQPTFFVGAPNTYSVTSSYDDYGTVGIGTNDTKGHTLGVKGDIIAEKMQVAMYSGGWPDYVFSKSYQLKPLPEIEKYIEKNAHLPNIPCATDVQQNGYDLADMDAKMLEKIEELTLYMIEMKKEIEELKKENEQLKSERK